MSGFKPVFNLKAPVTDCKRGRIPKREALGHWQRQSVIFLNPSPEAPTAMHLENHVLETWECPGP